jgi:DNA-binding response OmpR family regulator
LLSDQPLVLVVEDEYLLQTDVEEALNSGGFAAKTVSSGEAALTLFADGGAEKYKALITDVRLMGRLDGWDVARRIREKEAAFPVIYVTAYSAAEWMAHGVPNSILIPKPFASAQLITALSTLLNIGPTV